MDYQISFKRMRELVVRNAKTGDIQVQKDIFRNSHEILGWFIEPVFVKNLSVARDYIDSIYWKSEGELISAIACISNNVSVICFLLPITGRVLQKQMLRCSSECELFIRAQHL